MIVLNLWPVDQIFGFLDNADQVFLQLCHISQQLSFLCSGKLDLEMTSFIRASDIAVKQGPAADIALAWGPGF